MAIGDRVSYPAPIGISGGTTQLTGIDIGGGKIAISRGRQIPRPAGTRTTDRAGTPRALATASNLWVNPTAVLDGLGGRAASSPRASRTSGS